MCRGRSVRGGRAIPRCSTRRRTRRNRSCTGRRATPSSTSSSAPRGSGIPRIRTGTETADVERQRTTLERLFRYARPYRGRLWWAVVGMSIYAVGSAGLAALIRPIFDNVLPNQERVAWTAWAIVSVYLLKGLGSYASSYL